MHFHAKVSDRGRIIVPVQLRRSLGLNAGSDIVLREHDGELHIISLKQAIKKVQDMAHERIPDDVSLTDVLIQDRRAEARREEEKLQICSKTSY